MGASKSYDKAFQLCHTLKLYQNKFSKNKSLIIYPSAWYDGFFEIMFRDRDNFESKIEIDPDEILRIVNNFLKNENTKWEVKREIYEMEGNVILSPFKLQFKYVGEN